MLASSFAGLYTFLWSCVGASILFAIVGFGLLTLHRRRLGNVVALFGLLVSGFLLFDALRYHQYGGRYLTGLTIAVAGNLLAIVCGALFDKTK